MPRAVSLLAALLLLVALASAQEINVAIGLGGRPAPKTIFDEIEDARERGAFRELWEAAPRSQIDLASRFVDQYPRSVLLREAYELAARAHVAEGDLAQGLVWARRSLRLMPENPFLLVMIADIAAKQRDFDLAATSARDALRYLEHAEPPSQLSGQQWPQMRDGLRATALFVQGRVAAHREQYKEAEQSLLASLTLNPDDMEALYTIGVVRMAVRADEGAARAFSRVAQTDGPLAPPHASRCARCTSAQAATDTAVPASAGLRCVAGGAQLESARACRAGDPAPRSRAVCRIAGVPRVPRAGLHELAIDGHGADVQGLSARRRHRRLLGHADRLRSRARGHRMARATSSRSAAATTTCWVRYPVDYVIGSKWQQAYATRLAGFAPAGLPYPIQPAAIGLGQLLGDGGCAGIPAHRHLSVPPRAWRCGLSDHLRAVPHEPAVVRWRRRAARGRDVSRGRHQL